MKIKAKKLKESNINKKLRRAILDHQKSEKPSFRSTPSARDMIPMNINGTMFMLCPDTGQKLLARKHF
jgi:hypothetical protein